MVVLALAVLALVVLTVLLAWPAPRLLARWPALRSVPAVGLLLWQCVSLSAVLSGLAAGPMLVAGADLLDDRPAVRAAALGAGLAVSAVTLVLVLLSGHRTGLRLRRRRRRHRQLVDLLGSTADGHGAQVRVLEHPAPMAYCVPGLRQRVVLSQGALDVLQPPELAAVLAHERAHLRARHDLVLEFFTVLHTAVPGWVRSPAGLREVQLLVEVLADRAAVHQVGAQPLAGALVTLASGSRPEAVLAAIGGDTVIRLDLLAGHRSRTGLAVGVVAMAFACLALPVVLVVVGLAA